MKRASNLPRGAAILVVLLATLLAAALGACGTVLSIAPDEPSEGGSDEGSSGDGSTALDGAGSFVDFDAGDASTACGLSVDTKSIALGDTVFFPEASPRRSP